MIGLLSPRIFISYSREDGGFVDRLEADLKARNFQTWVDRNRLEAGSEWPDEIEIAINRSQVFLLVMSIRSLASDWVKKEYTYALGQKKRIIPILLEKNLKPPMILSNIQYEDFSKTEDYAENIEKLFIALTPLGSIPVQIESSEGKIASSISPSLPPLDELFIAGITAKEEGDLERAYVLWKQILERSPDYNNGVVKSQMQKLEKELQEARKTKLLRQAEEAEVKGEWRKAIGAWRALLGLSKTNKEYSRRLQLAIKSRAERSQREGNWEDEIAAWNEFLQILPQDTYTKQSLDVAQRNISFQSFYENIESLVSSGNNRAAKGSLDILWEEAPYYGDPKGIASILGIDAPPTFAEHKQNEARVARERYRLEEIEKKKHRHQTFRDEILGDAYFGEIILVLAFSIIFTNTLTYIISGSVSLGILVSACLSVFIFFAGYQKPLNTVSYLLTMLVSLISSFLISLNFPTGILLNVGGLDKLWLVSDWANSLKNQFNADWIFPTRTLWIENQLIFGTIVGVLSSLVIATFTFLRASDGDRYKIEDFPTLLNRYSEFFALIPCSALLWGILSFIASFFNWGFGFGVGWEHSLFYGLPFGLFGGLSLSYLILIIILAVMDWFDNGFEFYIP